MYPFLIRTFHPDFRSHTGAVMKLGNDGAAISSSSKQKLNTRSSCEAELVGADDISTKILWTKLFLEAQGFEVKTNILYQDNKSTILLLKNGKRSSGKRTRALNIRYFFLTDQRSKGNVEFEYCPTGEMISDFLTKPLQGKDFKRFREDILGSNHEWCDPSLCDFWYAGFTFFPLFWLMTTIFV